MQVKNNIQYSVDVKEVAEVRVEGERIELIFAREQGDLAMICLDDVENIICNQEIVTDFEEIFPLLKVINHRFQLLELEVEERWVQMDLSFETLGMTFFFTLEFFANSVGIY